MRLNISQEQEPKFLEDLYQKYKQQMLLAAYALVKPEYAEDIVQEALVKIIQQEQIIRRLPEPRRAVYIALIIRGTAVDFMRKQKRAVPMADIENIAERSIFADTARVMNQADKVELAVMLSELPQQDQYLLIGKYYFGLNSHELGRMIGCTAEAARAALHRAKMKVYTNWTGKGLNEEDFFHD